MSSQSAREVIVDLENPSYSTSDLTFSPKTTTHGAVAKSPITRKRITQQPHSPKSPASSNRTNSTVATSGDNSPQTSHESDGKSFHAVSPKILSSDTPGLAITTEDSVMAALPARMPRGVTTTQVAAQWKDDRLMLGPPIEIEAGEGIYRFPTPRQSAMAAPHALHAHPLTGMEFGIRNETHQRNQNVYRPQRSPRPKETQEATMFAEEKLTRSYTNRESPSRADGEAQKLSRWKSLGGLFGRRRGVQLQQTLPLRTTTSHVLLAEPRSASPKASPLQEPTRNGSVSAQGQQTGPGLFRRVTRRAAKPRIGPPLQRTKSSPGLAPKRSPINLNKELPQEPAGPVPVEVGSVGPAPTLDVDIPEVRMDRYSVMFKEVSAKSLPKRSSSILARRQGTEAEPTKPLRLNALAVPSPPRLRQRRSTEPLAKESLPKLETLTSLVYQRPVGSPAEDKLPHISTLHRPRPIQRKLSPEFEDLAEAHSNPTVSDTATLHLDDFVLVDRGSTPTPSSSKSPKTPTSLHGDFRDQEPAKSMPFQRNSWESDEANRLSVPTEIITIGKRLSPGDLLSTTIGTVTPRRGHPIEALKAAEAPRVAVARSMSLTRSNSQKVTVTRSISQRARPVGQAKLVTQRGPRREFSPPGSEPTVAVPPLPDRSDLRKDLNREIWGGRNWDNLADVKQTVLTPKLEEVNDATRKSVWGVIEEA